MEGAEETAGPSKDEVSDAESEDLEAESSGSDEEDLEEEEAGEGDEDVEMADDKDEAPGNSKPSEQHQQHSQAEVMVH